MEPTLRAGDWLLVDPLAYRLTGPTAGDLVVAADPGQPERRLVKRVSRLDSGGSAWLAGDHPAHGTRSQPPTVVAVSAILGRPWLRYWPPGRMGRLR